MTPSCSETTAQRSFPSSPGSTRTSRTTTLPRHSLRRYVAHPVALAPITAHVEELSQCGKYSNILWLAQVWFYCQCVQVLEEYNDKHKPMNLVLFENALEHLTRVHRYAWSSLLYCILFFPLANVSQQHLCNLAKMVVLPIICTLMSKHRPIDSLN